MKWNPPGRNCGVGPDSDSGGQVELCVATRSRVPSWYFCRFLALAFDRLVPHHCHAALGTMRNKRAAAIDSCVPGSASAPAFLWGDLNSRSRNRTPMLSMEYAATPSTNCPTQPMETANGYVEGTLPAPDNERFEDHFFQCDSCRMLVLRSATDRPGWNRRGRN